MILITGANGFIGSHLCKIFLSKKHEVIAVVRNKNSKLDSIKNLNNLQIVYCDMNDYQSLPELILKKIDIFYHLAWKGVFREDKSNYSFQMENCKSCLDAAHISKILGAKKFISVGTMAEYIIKNMSFDEIGSPSLMYAFTKYYTHGMLKLYCDDSHISYIWAILANTYGPGNVTGNVISYILNNLSHGLHVGLGKGNSYYDFVYILDCVNYLYGLSNISSSNKEYYIGSGSPRILRDYFEEIRQIVSPEGDMKFGEINDDKMVYDKKWLDISSIKIELKQSPVYSFSQGIKEMLKEIQNEK